MKKILIFMFLIIGIYDIYSEESNTVELPSKFFPGEIIYLNPYPVTTRSTSSHKEISLLSDSGENLAHIGVIVCYSNGQAIKYTSSNEGQIRLDSSRQIDKIYILDFEEITDDSIQEEHISTNSLHMVIEWKAWPIMIDLEPFPADQYTLILSRSKPFRISY
jgi:hypothetical protein